MIFITSCLHCLFWGSVCVCEMGLSLLLKCRRYLVSSTGLVRVTRSASVTLVFLLIWNLFANPLLSLRPVTFLLLPWISSLRHLHGSCPVLLQASFLVLKVRLLGNSCSACPKIAPLHSLSFHHALFFCPYAYHYFSYYYFMFFCFSNRMKAVWKQGLFLCQHFVLLTSVPLVLRLAWHVEDSKNNCWMSKSRGHNVFSVLTCFVCCSSCGLYGNRVLC